MIKKYIRTILILWNIPIISRDVIKHNTLNTKSQYKIDHGQFRSRELTLKSYTECNCSDKNFKFIRNSKIPKTFSINKRRKQLSLYLAFGNGVNSKRYFNQKLSECNSISNIKLDSIAFKQLREG